MLMLLMSRKILILLFWMLRSELLFFIGYYLGSLRITLVILHVHMCHTYIQHMHSSSFMWDVCETNTYTYALRYGQHTSGCISHMHSAYVICTYLYLYIFACHGICMYWVFIGAVSRAYVYVYLKQVPYIQEDTVRYALMQRCISACIWMYFGTTYSHICTIFDVHCILFLYTFRYAHFSECISACIWLYFALAFMQICTFHDVHIWRYLTVSFS